MTSGVDSRLREAVVSATLALLVRLQELELIHSDLEYEGDIRALFADVLLALSGSPSTVVVLSTANLESLCALVRELVAVLVRIAAL